jgi:competence protein ComEA
VEKEQLLEGNDSPTRFASELLPGEAVDLNSATVEELQRLDGIGPALAQAIVDYREQNGPFTALEQLLEIPGIGEKRLEKNRDRPSLGGETAPSQAEEEPLNTLPPP